MKSLSILILLATIFLSSFPAEAGFSCIGSPSLSSAVKKGDSCGGALSCEAGTYCDNMAICSPQRVIGDSCSQGNECPPGSQCAGSSASNKKCVAIGNPGDSCNEDNGANCGAGLTCLSNRCVAGKVGDGCKQNQDCESDRCVNNVCKTASIIGGSCPCGFGQYCKDTDCAGTKTSGSCTAGGNECAPGYSCIANSFKDDAAMTCLKRRSAAEGEWCHQKNHVCASGICHRGHCIDKSPVSCGQCVIGEICACEDGLLLEGSGICKEDKCQPLLSAFSDCSSSSCEVDHINYAQSCANRLCADAWNAYVACDPLRVLYSF